MELHTRSAEQATDVLSSRPGSKKLRTSGSGYFCKGFGKAKPLPAQEGYQRLSSRSVMDCFDLKRLCKKLKTPDGP